MTNLNLTRALASLHEAYMDFTFTMMTVTDGEVIRVENKETGLHIDLEILDMVTHGLGAFAPDAVELISAHISSQQGPDEVPND